MTFEKFSVEELDKLDIDEKDIENKSGEIQDVFTDLESEIDIKVQFKFEGNNKFLSHLYITLTSTPNLGEEDIIQTEKITDQVHKIREIGKSLSRLENCMQFYSGNAEYYDDYGYNLDFSFGLDFFGDYNEDSKIEDDEGSLDHVPGEFGDQFNGCRDSQIGIITKLEICFHYA